MASASLPFQQQYQEEGATQYRQQNSHRQFKGRENHPGGGIAKGHKGTTSDGAHGQKHSAFAANHPAHGMGNDESDEAQKSGESFFAPELFLCGDNAAMIGAQGYYEFLEGARADESLNAYPS